MAEISDDLKDNYRRLRAERGCSWSEMADQFERDGTQSVSSSVIRDGSSYTALAAWARSEAQQDGEQPPAPAAPRAPRRDARQQPPARTA